MARLTRAEALQYASKAILQWAASALSGKNVDGTDYTLPVEGTLNGGTPPATPWPVLPSAQEVHLGQVGGHSTNVPTGTFTRPGDTTAYAANDAVNNSTSAPTAISIATAARAAAGSLVIASGRLVKSTTNAAASGFRLWLYTATPSGTLANDNAAFTINAANKINRLGYIDFVAQVTGSDCVEFYGTPVFTMPAKLTSGTTIYGLLQSLGAYTPGNAEVFDIYLNVSIPVQRRSPHTRSRPSVMSPLSLLAVAPPSEPASSESTAAHPCFPGHASVAPSTPLLRYLLAPRRRRAVSRRTYSHRNIAPSSVRLLCFHNQHRADTPIGLRTIT